MLNLERKTLRTMTDKQFIRRVSKRTHMPQTKLREILDQVELQLKQDLVDGIEKVKLCDIIFYTDLVKEKIARNPRTGEKVKVIPFRKVRTRMSTDWKEVFKDYKKYSSSDLK